MAGEGQMLRAAREDKKWSLISTEETTKISVRYIKALEEENYGLLPGETYVKGYLRTYAKQLGLNSDEIIELYKSSIISEAGPIFEPSPKLRKFRPIWVRPAMIGIVAVLTIVLVIEIVGLSHSGKKLVDSSYVPAALPSPPQTEAVKPLPSVPKAETATPVPQTTPPNVEVASTDGLTAQLVFTQPCWIEVKVDGQPPFQAMYGAGTSKEVKGTSKIELVSVGNAGGLSVTLNGKPYPSLGTAGQVVHNVTLTPDTLKSL